MADVRFAVAAITDLTLARDWYEHECAGLGEEFVASVEAAVSRIGSFPSAGSPVGPGLRRQFLERFPYVLYYRTDDIGVLALLSRACTWHVARSIEYVACVASKMA